jgi:bifunctional non-homologous end joining protein LigD
LSGFWRRLALSIDHMALSESSPRQGRFGSPLKLSKVDWERQEMVVEVSHAEWTPDRLPRHFVDLGEREDKPAIDVRRSPPG